MSKLWIVCGLPASGKTHVANQIKEENPDAIYIATDDQLPRDEEGRIYWVDRDGRRRSWDTAPIQISVLTDAFRGAMQRVYEAISEEEGVIVEDLFESRLKRAIPMMFIDWYHKHTGGYDVEIVFCDTPVRECYERNSRRVNKVPNAIIDLMSMRFFAPQEDEAPIRVAKGGDLEEVACVECSLPL
jgi:tRNA uridine 5-carbamoylmethylation protein Kti12